MLTSSFCKLVLQALGGIQTGTTTLTDGYFMGLSSTEPTIAGANVTEPSDPNYSRIRCKAGSSATDPIFPFEFVANSNDKSIANKFEVHFNVASQNWVDPIRYFCIFSQNGTLLAYAPLNNALTVNEGYVPTILKGEAIISLDLPQQ